MGQIARRYFAMISCVWALLSLGACGAKPTAVANFAGSAPGITYVVETWEENGAISSDFTRVFVTFTHEGHTDKQLILDGPYLKVAGVRSIGRNDAVVCLSEGRVNSFKGDILLKAGGVKHEIRNKLDFHCGSLPTRA